MTPEAQLDFPPDPQRFCYGHPDVVTGFTCEGSCGRGICDTCSFVTAAGRFCPECMLAGTGGQKRRSPVGYAIGSIACAALGVCTLAGIFLGAAGKEAAGLLGVVAMLSPLVGLALGLVGRDYARRTGSPLSLIGIIGSSLTLGLYLILVVIGLSRR